MTNLKEAREKGKMEEFIKEREEDAPGDKERLEKTIDSFSRGKSKSTPKTSPPGSPEN